MAKVTITIEDKPDGNVSVKADPTFETIAMAGESGHEIEPSWVYALVCLRKIRDASKNLDKTRGRELLS